MAVEERGLLNLPTTADALPHLQSEPIQSLFSRTGVLTPVELESRYEVYSEQYILSIEVEAKLTINIAKTMIYPAAVEYLSKLSGTISTLSGLGIDFEKESAQTVANLAKSLKQASSKLEAALEKEDFTSTADHMQYCAQTLLPLMQEVRSHADALEAEVGNTFWPLPTYQEMLFIK